jgi:glycosyltransferase involved in cell wall biosynthesis
MKVLFVIDYLWDYRIPLYFRLNHLLGNVRFILTNWRSTKNLVVGLNCRVLRCEAELVSILLMENWDIMIWGEAGSRKFTLNLIDAILCLLICKIRRKPIIIWFGGWEFSQRDHWGDAHITNAIKRIGAHFIIPWLLRKADAIVTYGNFHKKFYAYILGINPNKIFIAPNSSIISEDEAESEKQITLLRRKLGLDGKKIILYVGRLEKRKNVDILIRAFAQIKRDDACLLIVGDGELRPYLEELCKQLGLRNVYFLGKIDRDRLPPYYRLCDVFVYPTAREPWGLAINEAMQFGKPVIATPRVAAAYDLVKQGINGFIVPENDVQALAKAINRIISDEKLAKRMGQKSKEIIVRSYTYEHMAEGFKEAIRYCCYKKWGC